MNQLEQDYQEAVERLYSVFEKYPLRRDTEIAEDLHEPDDELRLHSKPLRELSPDDLQKYGWSALLTWGEVEDFKHFLPRLFELLMDQECLGWPDPAVIFKKLHYADWLTWPDDERAAVEHYLMALWCWYLEDPEHTGAGDLLCGVGNATDDLTPYLQAWSDSGVIGHFLLADFIEYESDAIAKKRKLTDGFWRDKHGPVPFRHDRSAQMDQVIDWLLRPDTREGLERAFFEHMDYPIAQKIATAADLLNWLSALYPTNIKTADKAE